MRRRPFFFVALTLGVGCGDQQLSDEALMGPTSLSVSPGTTPVYAVPKAQTGSRDAPGARTSAALANSRMFWDHNKAAFRAGQATGTVWDDVNVGAQSIAMGKNTKASGESSVALGEGTIASAFLSVALGSYNVSSGLASTTLGSSTVARGVASTAIGAQSTAEAYASLAMGRWNELGGDMESWMPADPLFVIGNGTNSANRNNAFEVLKNGDTTVDGDATITGTLFVDDIQAVSDRDMKEDFRDVDGEQVLTFIASMPIQSWTYKGKEPSVRHLGPFAQDFYQAFRLGTDDKHISSIDIDGVNMVAVQALEKRTRELQAENEQLRATIARLETALLRVESAVMETERSAGRAPRR